MQTPLENLIGEMRRQAKTCETVSQDATEESLTGDACYREKNERDAKDWMIKSAVWLEAAAMAARVLDPNNAPATPCI